MRFRAVLVALLLITSTACGDDNSSEAVDVSADRCIVRLHGKGGSGATPTVDADGIAVLSPDGNGTGWGDHQWEYDTPAEIAEATGIITAAADQAGCERVVIYGFSNGASMAAALLCSGELLGDRLAGVVVDDPVTDGATVDCTPSTVPAAIYWTGALAEAAPAGTRCDSIDWTCDGDVVRGIDAYAADLGLEVTPSPFDEHRSYVDTPLPLTWLG